VSERLVVVGDTLLDVDLEGRAERLTPDAPVPVLDDLREHPRPGGAGLAALMAARDGHPVTLVTALGDDEAGERVAGLLPGVDVVRVRYDGPTPVKRRVRSGGQSLVRLDTGTAAGTVHGVPPELRRVLQEASAVLVADYGRGVVQAAEVRELLAATPGRVPVVWDPHPRGADPLPGARLVTPNRSEAALFAQRSGSTTTAPSVPAGTPLAGVRAHADALVASWRAQAVAVTLGGDGALLSYGDGAPVVLPAPGVTALDPCGAGDRFATTAAIALGSGSVTVEAVQQAVADASDYVARGGPASLREDTATDDPRPADAAAMVAAVAARGGTVVATGGCFDLLHAGHVATLRAARGLGDALVVCVNSDASVRRLKGSSRPLVPAADRVRVLEALECVDAVVVFDEDTPAELLDRLRPHVWAKGGDYAGADLPEAEILARWGGQAVVLPYLEGRSTTGLVRTATRLERLVDQWKEGSR